MTERIYKIMVADDDPMARDAIRLALIDKPWKTIYCADGFEAFEFCNNNEFDLAILDVNMPGPSGVEVCSWIKRHNLGVFTPVMLLTAERKIEQKISGLNCGADEYLTKPFNGAELVAHVEAMLRIKRLTDELRETKQALSAKEKQLVTMQLAGATAHELAQPLMQIMIACEMIPTLVDQACYTNSLPHEKLKNELGSLSDGCKLMRQIIRNLSMLDEYRTEKYVGKEVILEGLKDNH